METCKTNFMSSLNYFTNLQRNGHDRKINRLISQRLKLGQTFYSHNLFSHTQSVSVVEFSNDGQYLASGAEDKQVLVWNVSKALLANPGKPLKMKCQHTFSLKDLAFNISHSDIISVGSETILHDISTGNCITKKESPIDSTGLARHPSNDNLFVTCTGSRLLQWDIRDISRPGNMLMPAGKYTSIMYNPTQSSILATVDQKRGVYLIDTRQPRSALINFHNRSFHIISMSACFNRNGNQLLILSDKSPVMLYDIISKSKIAEFDYPEYYNSVTFKTGCFAGDDDEYVLSTSDNFKIYGWKIPSECYDENIKINAPSFVLRGHRSIANHVRYNYSFGIIASCGVEKIVKLWSTFPPYNSNDKGEYLFEEYMAFINNPASRYYVDSRSNPRSENKRLMAVYYAKVKKDLTKLASISYHTPRWYKNVLSMASVDASVLKINRTSFRNKNSSLSHTKKQKSESLLGIYPCPSDETEKSVAVNLSESQVKDSLSNATKSVSTTNLTNVSEAKCKKKRIHSNAFQKNRNNRFFPSSDKLSQLVCQKRIELHKKLNRRQRLLCGKSNSKRDFFTNTIESEASNEQGLSNKAHESK